MEAMPGFRLAIAGGGTGGHLFPGVAVATALQARLAEAKVLFVVGQRPMERDILVRHGFEAVPIQVEGLKGRGWKKGIPVLLKLPKSLFQSVGIIRRFRPSAALGVGGYSAGPFCAAAKWMGVPTAIHEQNSYPGVTNRLLARIVDRIFISFEESRPWFGRRETIVTGNPVRREFVFAGEMHPLRPQGFTVLVVGGSQGAQAINRTFVEALDELRKKGREVGVIHQTGAMDYERVSEDYRARGLKGEIFPFMADMAGAYSRADLVVGRAGAGTIFELAAMGKPSILIPYPHAANRHQEINADAMARRGGAEVMLQDRLTAEGLANALMRYLDDPPVLREMGERARQMSRIDAAEMIVEQLLEMARVPMTADRLLEESAGEDQRGVGADRMNRGRAVQP